MSNFRLEPEDLDIVIDALRRQASDLQKRVDRDHMAAQVYDAGIIPGVQAGGHVETLEKLRTRAHRANALAFQIKTGQVILATLGPPPPLKGTAA